MSAHRYPDQLSVRLPAGWRRRVERVAEREVRSPAPWLRELVRKALEAAERRERRRKATKR